MNFETVELIKKDKVATIKLNRPDKLNAFNEKLIWEHQKETKAVKWFLVQSWTWDGSKYHKGRGVLRIDYRKAGQI